MNYSTIIIPTRDRHDLLITCLDSLQHFSKAPKGDIVIVDTGTGEDARWADIQGYKPISMPGATYAQANNEAARRYPSEDLVLLNNDCFAKSDLLGWDDRHLGITREPAIIGARLLYPDGLTQHAGIGFDSNGGGYNLWRLAPSEHPEVVKRRYVSAVTFACARIPYHIWDELGGLDEGYHNCYEDVDLCLRAKEAGYPILYDPAVTAEHMEGQTEGRHTHDSESWQHYHSKWIASGRIFNTLGVFPFSVGPR